MQTKKRTISWSQAQTFRQCIKRWAYEKLDKIPQPPQEHFEHGKEVHSAIETALNKVIHDLKPASPSLAYVEYAVSLVMEASPNIIEVEQWIEDDLPDIKINGKADVILYRFDGARAIIDWKTSGKPPDRFKPDVQDQLHLYGHIIGLEKGDRIIACYPEHELVYSRDYDPEVGEEVYRELLATAADIEALTAEVSSAEELVGETQILCRWCPYEEICPDSYAKYHRQKIRQELGSE